jgi:hypothetical protein
MRRHTLAALALVPLLALGSAACGGGKDPVAKAAASRSSDLDAMRKFAQCMRQNGVDMPDPSDDGGRVRMKVNGKADMDKMKAAQEKCRHFQPNGGKPIKPDPQRLAQMRAMAKCMREHGVDMPDPNDDGSIVFKKGQGSGPNIDPDSPTFKAADKACRKYAPAPPGQQGSNNGGGS